MNLILKEIAKKNLGIEREIETDKHKKIETMKQECERKTKRRQRERESNTQRKKNEPGNLYFGGEGKRQTQREKNTENEMNMVAQC